MPTTNKLGIDSGLSPVILVGLIILVSGAAASAFLLTEREPIHLRDPSFGRDAEPSFTNRFVDGRLSLPEIPTRLGDPRWEDRIRAFLENPEISSLRLSQNDLNRIANDRFPGLGENTGSRMPPDASSNKSFLIPGEPRLLIAVDHLRVFSRGHWKPPYASVREVTLSMKVEVGQEGQLRVSDLYLNSARVPPPFRSLLVRRLVAVPQESQALAPLKDLFATAASIEIENYALVFSR